MIFIFNSFKNFNPLKINYLKTNFGKFFNLARHLDNKKCRHYFIGFKIFTIFGENMLSNYQNIGFLGETEQQYNQLIELVIKHKNHQQHSHDFNYDIYRDMNGLELWLILNSNHQITSLEPYFKGQTHQIGVDGLFVDEVYGTGWVQGWINATAYENDEWVNGDCPLIIDVPNVATLGDIGGHIIQMNLCAFAREIEIFDNQESYDNSGQIWASESLSPSGMFTGGEGNITARIHLSGEVVKVNCLVNKLTNLKFYHCQIKSYGGIFDAVYAIDLFEKMPKTGNIITGNYWLTGQICH
ncbi:hypothetical protein B5J94_06020 [Moraxella lacunata]|uniref:Uncharacterized protein n=2 Tax=Moraxella lacunata TaxID=477 RepID=A0A1V4GXW7_MORLA|nr:hypothetical protein B5J94_06020 [Moraxella lacunata]